MKKPYLSPEKIAQYFEQPTDRFLNRELSWLTFNERVLKEAYNERHPLLERLKFLSISASNLDEFYMVRVASLKDLVGYKVDKLSQDGLSPAMQLEKIYEKAQLLMEDQQQCWVMLREALAKEQIKVVNSHHLSDDDKLWLKTYFMHNIFPALTPLAIDPAHPFPLLPNLGLAIVLHLHHKTQKKQLKVVLPIPQKLRRFIALPGSDPLRFITLEEVVLLCKAELFMDSEVISHGFFRITRHSDLEISDEAEDLVSHFEWAVKQRKRGSVIRLKITHDMPEDLRNFVIEELEVHPEDVIEIKELLGIANLQELLSVERRDLKFPSYVARFPERITDFGEDYFSAIYAKDIVVHHPYETFDVVVQFLRQAARDPDVVAIKQTLYRTSENSEVVKALIEAAEAGKSVTVVVELKARFDEEANIRWARNLERAGAQIVYGLVGLKTHAKLSLVIRKVEGQLRSYIHFGTGNYHPITAKIYSDLSFFTCDPVLCKDAAHIFNFLTGSLPPESLEKLAMAPLTLRDTLIKYIYEEIEHAKAGRPANIWAKMNALVDEEIIDMLYYASQQGVLIDLIVRGVCCLRPGIKGFSDNIRVKSIVGRFLEHARIFCFGAGHGLPSAKSKVFISSADWMRRNLDRRVEVMVPIENPTVHEQLLGQVMQANLKDDLQSWYLSSDGTYQRAEPQQPGFSAHEFFMTNPSLSGRGTALRRKTNVAFKPRIPKTISYDEYKFKEV